MIAGHTYSSLTSKQSVHIQHFPHGIEYSLTRWSHSGHLQTNVKWLWHIIRDTSRQQINAALNRCINNVQQVWVYDSQSHQTLPRIHSTSRLCWTRSCHAIWNVHVSTMGFTRIDIARACSNGEFLFVVEKTCAARVFLRVRQCLSNITVCFDWLTALVRNEMAPGVLLFATSI